MLLAVTGVLAVLTAGAASMNRLRYTRACTTYNSYGRLDFHFSWQQFEAPLGPPEDYSTGPTDRDFIVHMPTFGSVAAAWRNNDAIIHIEMDVSDRVHSIGGDTVHADYGTFNRVR
jgi:hypothetical protein